MASKTQTQTGVPLMPKGLKTKSWPVILPGDLADRIRKPITGQGGWQSILKDLQTHTDGEKPFLELPDKLLRRMIPYAVKFGGGGYQSLIRWVLCCALEQHMIDILGSPVTIKSLAGVPETPDPSPKPEPVFDPVTGQAEGV